MITRPRQYLLISTFCLLIVSCAHNQIASPENLVAQRANKFILSNMEIKFPDYAENTKELKNAMNLELGIDGPQSFEGARRVYLALAKEGNLLATVKLGEYFELGLGGKRDLELAREYYLAAASKDYHPAMNNLGLLLHVGPQESRDFDRAKYWYLKAAQRGDVFAFVNLSDLYQKLSTRTKKYDRERTLLSQLVINREIPRSLYTLGLNLTYGTGVDQDIETGERLLKKSRYWNNKCGDIKSEARRYSNIDSTQALESAVFYHRYYAEICDLQATTYLKLYVKFLNSKRAL